MDDLQKNVLIKVDLDTKSAEQSASDLGNKLKEIGSDGGAAETIEQLKNALKGAGAEVERVRTEFGENSKQYGVAVQKLMEVREATSQVVGGFKQTYVEVQKNAELMRNLFGETSDEYKRAKLEVEDMKKSMSNIVMPPQGEKSVQSFKTQLRLAREEALQMGQQFGTNSRQFVDATRKVAELKDQMEEFNMSVAAMDPDNKFKALSSIAKGAANAVQGVAGAMTFLGVESETAQETIAKLQGLMAFTDAINSIDDIKNGYKNLMNVLGLTTSATKAQTVAVAGETVATEGATVATKGLGVAFKSIGIGLLISAIAYLISNWQDVKKVVTDLFPSLNTLGGLFNKVKEVVVGVGTAVVEYAITPIKALIKVIKGDFQGAIDEVKKGADVIKNFQDGRAKQANKDRVAEAKDILKESIERNENQLKILEKGGKDTNDLQRRIFQQKKLLYQRGTKEFNEVTQEQQEFEAGVRKKAEDDAEKAAEKVKAEAKKKADEEKAARAKALAELKADNEKLKSHLEEINKITDGAVKTTSVAGLTNRDKDLQDLENSIKDQQDRLKKAHDESMTLLDKELKEKLIKQDEYNKKVAELNAATGKADNAITEEKAAKGLAIEKKYNDILKEFITSETADAFDKQKASINKHYDELIQEAAGKQDIIDQLLALRDNKLKGVDANKASFKAETTLINTQVDNREKVGDTPKEAKDKIANIALAELDAENAAYEAKKAAAIGQNEELERIDAEHKQKLVAITKDHKEKIKQYDDAMLMAKMDMYNAIGSGIGALGELFNRNTVAAKALALTQIAIETGVGFMRALTIAQQTAEAAGPGAAFAFPIFYASQVAAVLGAASRAKSILVSSSNSGGNTSTMAPPMPSAPTINGTNVTMQGPQDVRVVNHQDQTIRAYITDKDVQASQNRTNFLNNISSWG